MVAPRWIPQAALEAAGGADAWSAMFTKAYATIDRPGGAPGAQCPTVPITP